MLHAKLLELETTFQPSILTQIETPLLKKKQLEVWIKRDDLIHSIISGNKWRKLKYFLDYVLKQNGQTIYSMGGAYSNHLHALSFVAKQLGINTVGYIRGEKPVSLNPTLIDMQNWGMQLRFISRTEFRQLRQYKLVDAMPDIEKGQYWLAEGGATDLALKGVAEIIAEIKDDFDHLCVPCGTGATLAGLISAAPMHCKIHGFSALKGADFLIKDVNHLLGKSSLKPKWNIQLGYHFGGFAKTNNELLLFIKHFSEQFGVDLEPVYSGKMFYGLFDLVAQDFFQPGQKIIAIHTGGLQGNRVNKLDFA